MDLALDRVPIIVPSMDVQEAQALLGKISTGLYLTSALEEDCRRHGTILTAEVSLALKQNFGRGSTAWSWLTGIVSLFGVLKIQKL